MPKTRKKFIDKKRAVTFNLVHRSQRDPLAADETAPQRVLVPVNAVVPPSKDKDPELTPEQRKEEQRKYGVYFEDDYNYLQHLKDTKEVTMVMQPKQEHKKKEKSKPTKEQNEELIDKLQLPSSVFASEVEEDVGLLNKAATQGLCLDLDPEVVAALDDDFDFEDPDNALEDNFIELAMAEGSEDDDDDDDDDEDSMASDAGSEEAFASDSDDYSDEDGPRRMPNWDPHGKEETKSRFSQYSMSSSVMKRNQGLSLLDDRFEKMFAEYDDTEIGALDLEEIEGFMPETHRRLLEAAEELELETEGSEDDDDDDDDDEDSMASDAGSEEAFASDSDDYSDEDGPRRMPNWDPHGKEETKSRFSQYSMSSSVMKRNQGLSLLDDRFEKMFAEYDDTEIGALDLEEIEGFMPETHRRLLEAAEELETGKKKLQLEREKEVARLQRLQEISEESEEDLVEMEVQEKEKWDCETILSTYSNLYNHPKVIEEPKKSKKIQIDTKTGIPKDVLGKDSTKLTVKSLAKFNALNYQDQSDDEDGRTQAETVLSTLSVLSIRPKEESPEEKKERKRLLKEYRKERRIEKKANKEAFKEEKKRQEKIMLNNRNNVQGNKIL